MPLFWFAYADGPRVFISDSGGEPGMIKASMAGMEGRAAEVHTLDAQDRKQDSKGNDRPGAHAEGSTGAVGEDRVTLPRFRGVW
jgi:hypothetical protein